MLIYGLSKSAVFENQLKGEKKILRMVNILKTLNFDSLFDGNMKANQFAERELLVLIAIKVLTKMKNNLEKSPMM